jgi:alcohol dehydrogenase
VTSCSLYHVPAGTVHGKSVDFQIQKLWIHNITLTTGLVNTNTTPMLLKTVESKKLQPQGLITHRFTFDRFMEGSEVGNTDAQTALTAIVKVQ